MAAQATKASHAVEYQPGSVSRALLVGGSSSSDAAANGLAALFSQPPEPVKMHTLPRSVITKIAKQAVNPTTTGTSGTAQGQKKSHKTDPPVSPAQREARKGERSTLADEEVQRPPPTKRKAPDVSAAGKKQKKHAAGSPGSRSGLDFETDNLGDEVQQNQNADKELSSADTRTVFVGNVLPDSAKDLKRFFKKFGTVESIRFRSVPVLHAKKLGRKAMFIAKELKTERQSCNAYIVFKDDAAAVNALEANGDVFQERHIRVDAAGQNSAALDSRHSIFVGNLPFAVEEEELWTAFADCGAIKRVRVIRDKITNLGKGFAYVQFDDVGGVEMALQAGDIHVQNRPLRISRALKKPKHQAKHVARSSSTSSTRTPKPSNKITTKKGGQKRKFDEIQKLKQMFKKKKSGFENKNLKSGGNRKGKARSFEKKAKQRSEKKAKAKQ